MFRSALFTLARILLVISVGMAFHANSAAAEDAIVTTIPIAASFTNTCTGELVFYTATQHIKAHFVSTDQHDQIALEFNYQDGKGVTATGINYIAKQNIMSVDNSGPESASTYTFRLTQHLTRLKEDPTAIATAMTGDDLVVTITEKLTVTPSGAVTADRPFEMVVDCR